MKRSIVTLIASLIVIFGYSQQLTQTVRGTLIDTDSKRPLIGASVVIIGTNPLIGTVTDIDGIFRLEEVPTGRIALELAYLGYEGRTVSGIVVNSGKEVVLELEMEESIVKIDEVVVTATKNKGEAINDMATVSARSISPEQTNRYAGGFNDPSRIMSNFAGVTSTQDGSNDIIVRGNSPKYVQWRLEGVQITNPNHFADPSAVGGAVSTLNNNLLANSDFYTGAFAPEYGDVLSGVYDVRLRAGNNEQFESVFGFGLLGTDLTLEGPFKKGYGGSYIVNYRYSTATIIDQLGLIPDVGVPKFQDAAFKVVLPTEKMGVFSMFALGGKSSFLFEDVTPSIWETPGDASMNENIREDFEKGAYLLNTGLNHTLPISDNSYIKTTLAYSIEGIEDDIFQSDVINFYDDQGIFEKDSIINTHLGYKNRLKKSTYRGAITYHHKINARHKLQLGTKYALFNYDLEQSLLPKEAVNRFTLADFDGRISTIRNFVSWKYRVGESLTLVSGFHNMNVLYNNKHTLEPRIAMKWEITPGTSIHAGYGNHSNMESVHNYFARVEQADGTITEPNKDLDLLKAHHYVIGFEKRIGKNLMAKVEAYYQDLYNLPVENNDTSFYATINEGLDFKYVDLVNEGTGENYGVEITLERFFNNSYYYMINGSLYQSKYKTLEGKERNTSYNGNYLVNILFGKEFEKLGKKQNQTLGLNAKAFWGGGRKIIPLLRDENGQLAVNPEKGLFWDYEKAYESSIEDAFQLIISASYKWNNPKATHELFINLDNVTDHKGKISEYYDEREPGSIGYVTQFGFFPNLMYRVYF